MLEKKRKKSKKRKLHQEKEHLLLKINVYLRFFMIDETTGRRSRS